MFCVTDSSGFAGLIDFSLADERKPRNHTLRKGGVVTYIAIGNPLVMLKLYTKCDDKFML
jgi:hypothetical protein